MDLTGLDLALSHFTLDRYHDIEARVRAAAAAGCASIGLYIDHYRRLESDGVAPGRLTELLDEHGLCLSEIDVLRDWGDPSASDTEQYHEWEATAWRMADAFGCRYVQALGKGLESPSRAGRRFGALCDRAADHGLRVALEFVPAFTDVVDAAAAMEVIESADRDNGGLCVDIWHHQRGANDLALIEAIPGHRIVSVQMSDGTLAPQNPDYYEDCLTNRVPPGSGEFDVAGFVAAIRSTGADVPWSLEACNAGAWASDGLEFVAECATGMRVFLQR